MKQYVFDHEELQKLLTTAWAHGFIDGLTSDLYAFKNEKKLRNRWEFFNPIGDREFGAILRGEGPDTYHIDFKKRA